MKVWLRPDFDRVISDDILRHWSVRQTLSEPGGYYAAPFKSRGVTDLFE